MLNYGYIGLCLKGKSMLKNFLIATFTALILSTTAMAEKANEIKYTPSPVPATMLKEAKNSIPDIRTAPIETSKTYRNTDALDIVKSPKVYYRNYVKITGKVDKFSTLGLDYNVIKKDSKDYISFLIKREDVKDYNIPLSELKLIVKRDYAEKELINLEPGDEIKILGRVFSLALGDPWIEVDKVEYVKKEKIEDKK